MKKLTALLCLLLSLVSCEKETSWTLHTSDSNYIVVDGLITNENKIQQIKLTKPYTFDNDSPAVVSGASLVVSSNDKIYYFHEDQENPGTYLSNDLFAAKINREYSLLISYENKIVTSKARMAVGAEFIFLRYTLDKDSRLYKITWVANPFNALRPAMYEILLDWSAVAGYENLTYDETHARLLYYSLPTIDVSQIFAPDMESIRFPSGTTITERKYSLTTEHAAYLRALLSETTWQGGLFNTAPANLPTNLSGNGMGYFGICAVTQKTEIAGVTMNTNPNYK